VTDSYEYDAFGNKINSTGTTPNNYLYRGEQYDSDLGLYYLRARYYNPATGRFLSRDPQEYQPLGPKRIPVDPKKLHKYLYASGDPVNRIDPSGRADDEEEVSVDALDALMARARTLAPMGESLAIALCSEATAIWMELNPGYSPTDAMLYYASCVEGLTGGGL
jgi:RHS repeat-associated protein